MGVLKMLRVHSEAAGCPDVHHSPNLGSLTDWGRTFQKPGVPALS